MLCKDGLSCAEIGRRYGVSRERIRQLKKEYMQSHPELFNNLLENLTPSKLEKLLKSYNQKEIANLYHCSPATISKHMKKWGLNIKKAEEILPAETLRTLFIENMFTDREIAALFELSPPTIERLRKKYNIKAKERALRKNQEYF